MKSKCKHLLTAYILNSVGARLFEALFHADYTYASYNLHSKFDEIKKRYYDFKITEGKQTLPKFEQIFSWKGYEIRFFLLYIMIPLLQGFLAQEYMDTLVNLVTGILLLSQQVVTIVNVDIAKQSLMQFSVDIATKWGQELCFINVHDITHLADQVLKFGPMWVYSGFYAEACLGYYVKRMFATLVNQ